MASKRINSRNKGIHWELKLLKELKNVFPDILTSRNASRKEDKCGCDYVNTKDLCIQVKATKSEINPFKLYEELINRQKTPLCPGKDIVIIKVYQASQYRRQDYDIIVFLSLDLFNKLSNGNNNFFYVVKQMKSGWRAKYFQDEYKEFVKVLAGTINNYPEFLIAITFNDFINLLENGLQRNQELKTDS